jgi:hypothetical protein
VRAILQAANRGNVTIHTFDPRPLGSAPIGGADVMARMATETGGRRVANANEPSARLAQTLADASAYYLLGYTPTRGAADGKYRRIEVKVKRSGLRVVSRRGYWAAAPETVGPAAPAKPEEPGLREALTDIVEPRAGRAVDVWVGLTRAPEGATRVTVAWERSRQESAAAPHALEVERIERTAGVTTPRVVGEPITVAAATAGTFDLPPGQAMLLRLTARSQAGEVLDRWEQAVAHTKFGEALAFATPRFVRARSAFEARALENGGPGVPAASREFRRTDRVRVELDCYGAGADLAVTAELLNDRGARLTSLDVASPGNGRTALWLPTASLAPGLYVLRLEARTLGATAQERVAFRLIP